MVVPSIKIVCVWHPQYSWRAMQQMTQRLIKRLSALGQYEEAVAALSAVALERPASLKNKLTSAQRADAMSVCDDPFVLAQQLTHIELVSGQRFIRCLVWGSFPFMDCAAG